MDLLLIAIACGVVAVLYGILTSRQVLASSPGNQKMVDVAGAIQEGASAYLRRQYTAISVVGGTARVLGARKIAVVQSVRRAAARVSEALSRS